MELIDLSSGASYFHSPDVAIETAVASLRKGHTAYGPTEGLEALREAVASRYPLTKLTAENVLITPGTKQALFNLFYTLLREHDEILVTTPAWFGFHNLLKYTKGKLVTLPASLENNYALDLDALQLAITPRTRILLLTNPGNPTGRLYSKKELEAVLNITAYYPDLYLISDEIYDLVTYSKPFTSVFSCQGAKAERRIVVNGFSKSFAMSGWRLGYVAGPADLISSCADFQGSTYSGVSLFLQEAALAVLKDQNTSLSPMLKILKENRQLMQEGLSQIPAIRFYVPDGAYYFFPDLNAYLNTVTPQGKVIHSTITLCQFLHEEYQLKLAPGDPFGAPGHARMSFAVEQEKLQEALSRLKTALLTLKPQT